MEILEHIICEYNSKFFPKQQGRTLTVYRSERRGRATFEGSGPFTSSFDTRNYFLINW